MHFQDFHGHPLRQLAGLLDATLSVDSLRLYKPRPEVYQLAVETLGEKPADITFVSSNRWDVMGAVAFGFKAFWINRAGQPDEYLDLAPQRQLTALTALTTL